MTDEEALTEARRRWGDAVRVRHDSGQGRWVARPYAVSVQKDALFTVYGEGNSWEEAFQDAGRRPSLPAAEPAPSRRPPDPS
jgi:hypothetical protein